MTFTGPVVILPEPFDPQIPGPLKITQSAAMDLTSKSLLFRAGNGDDSAWQRLANLYQPMVRNWLAQQSLPAQEADDLTQDVMATLVEKLPEFEHNGRVGAFRNWLRVVTVNRVRSYWRRQNSRPDVRGGTAVLELVDQLEDPASDVSANWNAEHDDFILRQALKQLSEVFEEKTLTAFRRLAILQEDVQAVADDLEMTVAAVYGAKARVLHRLRMELDGIIEL